MKRHLHGSGEVTAQLQPDDAVKARVRVPLAPAGPTRALDPSFEIVNPENEKLLNVQVAAGFCAPAAIGNTNAKDNNKAASFIDINKVN